MAAENSKWLSFSLSPMEMLSSSHQPPQTHYHNTSVTSTDSHHYYYLDNYYDGWENAKIQGYYEDRSQTKEVIIGQSIGETSASLFQTFFDTQPLQVPKLEDFLGADSALVRYSDPSQTDTQDSSLTNIYDHSAYFNDPNSNGFRAMTCTTTAPVGFQAFSTNSGSEVDDSGSVVRTQLACQSIESNEVAFPQSTTSVGLTLAVDSNSQTMEKAMVSVDSDSSKMTSDTFGLRTSIYRGVTRHRWTGRYEAHLWDNSCRREGQARKGRQVYLGGYDKEDKAARSYDLAALKYWGPTATTNFPVSSYSKELEEMQHNTKQEFIASLRRKSSGFSRGASIYRGVTRHHQQGRWQARIGRVAGNKDLYLGTFATEEEAAEAYDIAAIKFRGINAVTNFEMNRYDVEAIMKSSLPIGGAAKRLKLSLEAEQKPSLTHTPEGQNGNSISCIDFSNCPPIANLPYEVQFDPLTRYHPNLYNFNGVVSDPPGTSSAMVAAPVTFLPSSTEFFLWPHQSY